MLPVIHGSEEVVEVVEVVMAVDSTAPAKAEAVSAARDDNVSSAFIYACLIVFLLRQLTGEGKAT